MLRRIFRICVVGLLFTLVGCAPQATQTSTQLFAMDTIMSLSAYGVESDQAVSQATALLYQLENLLSVTDQNSDIWAINHAQGQWVTVSDHTLAVLQEALTLAEDTAGAIDPTIYPAMTAWGFTTGNYQVPDSDTVTALLPLVDYSAVEVDEANSAVRIPEGMALDLGSIAKGYASDLVAELFTHMDYAILSLGGNAYVVGQKPDGDLWRVGVQDPSGDGYLAIVSPSGGNAVITSGGYQRYFQEDGVTHWHILDPSTASPAESDLVSVTVIGESGTLCDGLSTALFVMGLEGASDYWRSHQTFDLVLMDEDGTLHVTETIYPSFTLADGVEVPVEVIVP